MRSPGRCTNHETCWLGNGQRTVRVSISDPFCCPVCGAALVPPPIEAIAQKGIRRAAATSLVLVLAAAGSGFGLVALLHTAGINPPAAGSRLAAVKLPPKRMPQAAHPAPVQLAQIQGAQTPPVTVANTMAAPVAAPPGPAQLPAAPHPQQPAAAAITAKPVPADAPTVELATRVLATPPAHILIATNVSQEPLRATMRPILFGRPLPPEEDMPARPSRWRYRPLVAVRRHNELLPAPGVPPEWDGGETTGPAEAQTISAVSDDPVPQAEPVADDDGAANTAGSGATPAVFTSNMAPDSAPPPLPETAPRALPSFTFKAPPVQWVSVSGPAPVLPDSQSASRIDPAEASQMDPAPDAPRRLATMPPAAPDKLATPTYPAIQEAVERPGRVDVGCIITQRGLPDRCHVQREYGGDQFTASVLTWLKSGEVRYRPRVTHGQPVAEARDYRVRFEP